MPENAKVRIALVYSKDIPGETADVTVENGAFSIPIEFLTQSRKSVFDRLEKCDRRPKTVVVTLVEQDRDFEYDRVALDFASDFKLDGAKTYVLRSEVLLDGSHQR